MKFDCWKIFTRKSNTSYSLDESQKWENINRKIVTIIFALTIGVAFPVGYNLAVLNSLGDHIPGWYTSTIVNRYDVYLQLNELKIIWASIVSALVVGALIGSHFAASISNKIGRKKPLLISAGLFAISAALFGCCRLAESVEMIIIARLLIGLAIGISTCTASMYLDECSSSSIRKTTSGIFSIGVTFGILCGAIFSVREIFGSDELWHYGLIAHVVFVPFIVLPYLCLPESPKYLYLIKGDKEAARNVLRRLRGEQPKAIEDELDQMYNELKITAQDNSLSTIMKNRSFLLPIVLVCIYQGGIQFTGTIAIANYSIAMLESTGLESYLAKWINVAFASTLLISTCLGMRFINKINRRPIIIVSLATCCLLNLFLILIVSYSNADETTWLSYASIAVIIGFIGSFQFGLGTISNIIENELFESNSQSAIKSLTNVVSWICKFCSAIAFPNLQVAWSEYVYLPFLIVSVILAIIFLIFLPETRKGCAISSGITNGVSHDVDFRPNVDAQKSQKDLII